MEREQPDTKRESVQSLLDTLWDSPWDDPSDDLWEEPLETMRSSPMDTRSSPMDTRSSPMDTRTSPMDTRTSPEWIFEPMKPLEHRKSPLQNSTLDHITQWVYKGECEFVSALTHPPTQYTKNQSLICSGVVNEIKCTYTVYFSAATGGQLTAYAPIHSLIPLFNIDSVQYLDCGGKRRHEFDMSRFWCMSCDGIPESAAKKIINRAWPHVRFGSIPTECILWIKCQPNILSVANIIAETIRKNINHAETSHTNIKVRRLFLIRGIDSETIKNWKEQLDEFGSDT